MREAFGRVSLSTSGADMASVASIRRTPMRPSLMPPLTPAQAADTVSTDAQDADESYVRGSVRDAAVIANVTDVKREGPSQVAWFRRRVIDDPPPICITGGGDGPRQRAFDLSAGGGYSLRIRGSDPDFNLQRSYRNLDNPFEGWDVRFVSPSRFEAALVRAERAEPAGGVGSPTVGPERAIGYVSGSYRWVPTTHTRSGSLELLLSREEAPGSASDYGRAFVLTISGDDPLATSSWGPVYAWFDPDAFPSPGALAERAMLQQTLRPRYNESMYLSRTVVGGVVRGTPTPGLWTVGAAPETAAFVRGLTDC